MCGLEFSTKSVSCLGQQGGYEFGVDTNEILDNPITIWDSTIHDKEVVKLYGGRYNYMMVLNTSELVLYGMVMDDYGYVPPIVIWDEPILGTAFATKNYCLLAMNHTVMCGGYLDNMWIGSPDAVEYGTLYPVINVTATVIGASSYTFCALTNNQTSIMCWGNISYGTAGRSECTDLDNIYSCGESQYPAPVYNVIHQMLDIQGGEKHLCVLYVTGHVGCWGYNYYGQLGRGIPQTKVSDSLEIATEFTFAVSTIALGDWMSCGLSSTSNEIYCVGFSDYIQYGSGVEIAPYYGLYVLPFGNNTKSFVMNGEMYCADYQNYTVWCIGTSEIWPVDSTANDNPRQFITMV